MRWERAITVAGDGGQFDVASDARPEEAWLERRCDVLLPFRRGTKEEEEANRMAVAEHLV